MKICKCFICERVKEEVPLIALPFEVKWQEATIEILGNLEDGETVCLVCMGYLLDDVIAMREQENEIR